MAQGISPQGDMKGGVTKRQRRAAAAAFDPNMETFRYSSGDRHMTFVVVERMTKEDHKKAGNERMFYFMRDNLVVATVKARKLHGEKVYLFYELSRGDTIWRSAVDRV